MGKAQKEHMAHVQQLRQPQFQAPLNWDPMMMRLKMRKMDTPHRRMVSLLIYKHRHEDAILTAHLEGTYLFVFIFSRRGRG